MAADLVTPNSKSTLKFSLFATALATVPITPILSGLDLI
jgi:hypothetical protein